MKFIKILSLLVAFMLVLGITGCSNDTGKVTQTTTQKVETTTQKVEEMS